MNKNNKYCDYCGSVIERFFSISTAAQICDLSEQFFRNLIRDRKIKFVKFGRSIRIPASALSELQVEFPTINELYKTSSN